jgi:hypothetical protein
MRDNLRGVVGLVASRTQLGGIVADAIVAEEMATVKRSDDSEGILTYATVGSVFELVAADRLILTSHVD